MTRMNLVLHIGTEKTGTKLLQRWLYANRQEFSANRVFLSEKLDKPSNRKLVACFHAERDDYWNLLNLRTAADRERFFSGFLEDFAAELRDAEKDHDTIVITAEHFHSRLRPAEISDLAEFCGGQFGSVRILCYLRPQWDVRRSLYSTAVRGAGELDFPEFQRDVQEDSPYYNYHDLYTRWRTAFPDAAMDFRLYDRRRFPEGDIRRDFLSAIAPDMDATRLDPAIDRANESLSLLKARAFLAVNRTLPLFPQGGFDRRNSVYKGILDKVARLNRGAFHDDRAEAMCDTFRASNMALSTGIFDGSDLFGRPQTRAPVEETMTLDEVAALVEELVGALVAGTSGRFLAADEVDVLRDVALKGDAGTPPTRQDAIRLLQVVQRVSPERQQVREILRAWTAREADDGAGG